MKQELESLKAGSSLFIALFAGVMAVSCPVQAQNADQPAFSEQDAANLENMFNEMERNAGVDGDGAGDGVVAPTLTAKVVCPIGGEVFEFTRMPTVEPDAVRLDYRGIRDDGQLVEPLPVPVCPGNGLPVYRTDFTPKVLEAIEAFMQTEDWKTLRSTHEDFYVIAKLLDQFDQIEDRHGSLTFAYMAAAWEIEGADDAKFNAYYREALTNLDKVLEKGLDSAKDRWALTLLGVDLSRRIGAFDEATARLQSLPFGTMPDNERIRLTYSYERQLIIDKDTGAYMIRREVETADPDTDAQ